MKTRTVKISMRRMGVEGRAYLSRFLGLRVAFVDYEGTTHLGVIERFGWSTTDHLTGVGYPIMRTDDGRTARLDHVIEVVR